MVRVKEVLHFKDSMLHCPGKIKKYLSFSLEKETA